MAASRLIVVGASAGGVEALTLLFSKLPVDLQAAVLVVLHVSSSRTSLLPSIINRKSQMPASHAIHGEEIHNGHIYIAPSDNHMIVKDGRLLLTHGPRINKVRPSIDVLFHSAAESHNSNVIGVILTGTLTDGVQGLQDVKLAGGTVIVQNPHEAAFSGMPSHAIENVDADYVLTIDNIAETITRLVEEPGALEGKQTKSTKIEKESEGRHSTTSASR